MMSGRQAGPQPTLLLPYEAFLGVALLSAVLSTLHGSSGLAAAGTLAVGGIVASSQAVGHQHKVLTQQLAIFLLGICGLLSTPTFSAHQHLAICSAFWLLVPANAVQTYSTLLPLLLQAAEVIVTLCILYFGKDAQLSAQSVFMYFVMGLAVPVGLASGCVQHTHASDKQPLPAGGVQPSTSSTRPGAERLQAPGPSPAASVSVWGGHGHADAHDTAAGNQATSATAACEVCGEDIQPATCRRCILLMEPSSLGWWEDRDSTGAGAQQQSLPVLAQPFHPSFSTTMVASSSVVSLPQEQQQAPLCRPALRRSRSFSAAEAITHGGPQAASPLDVIGSPQSSTGVEGRAAEASAAPPEAGPHHLRRARLRCRSLHNLAALVAPQGAGDLPSMPSANKTPSRTGGTRTHAGMLTAAALQVLLPVQQEALVLAGRSTQRSEELGGAGAGAGELPGDPSSSSSLPGSVQAEGTELVVGGKERRSHSPAWSGGAPSFGGMGSGWAAAKQRRAHMPRLYSSGSNLSGASVATLGVFGASSSPCVESVQLQQMGAGGSAPGDAQEDEARVRVRLVLEVTGAPHAYSRILSVNNSSSSVATQPSTDIFDRSSLLVAGAADAPRSLAGPGPGGRVSSPGTATAAGWGGSHDPCAPVVFRRPLRKGGRMSRSYGDLRGIGFQGSSHDSSLYGLWPASGSSAGAVQSVGSPGTPQAAVFDLPAPSGSANGRRPVARSKSRFCLLASEGPPKSAIDNLEHQTSTSCTATATLDTNTGVAAAPGATSATATTVLHGHAIVREPEPSKARSRTPPLSAPGDGSQEAGEPQEEEVSHAALYFLEHSDAEMSAGEAVESLLESVAAADQGLPGAQSVLDRLPPEAVEAARELLAMATGAAATSASRMPEASVVSALTEAAGKVTAAVAAVQGSPEAERSDERVHAAGVSALLAQPVATQGGEASPQQQPTTSLIPDALRAAIRPGQARGSQAPDSMPEHTGSQAADPPPPAAQPGMMPAQGVVHHHLPGALDPGHPGAPARVATSLLLPSINESSASPEGQLDSDPFLVHGPLLAALGSVDGYRGPGRGGAFGSEFGSASTNIVSRAGSQAMVGGSQTHLLTRTVSLLEVMPESLDGDENESSGGAAACDEQSTAHEPQQPQHAEERSSHWQRARVHWAGAVDDGGSGRMPHTAPSSTSSSPLTALRGKQSSASWGAPETPGSQQQQQVAPAFPSFAQVPLPGLGKLVDDVGSNAGGTTGGGQEATRPAPTPSLPSSSAEPLPRRRGSLTGRRPSWPGAGLAAGPGAKQLPRSLRIKTAIAEEEAVHSADEGGRPDDDAHPPFSFFPQSTSAPVTPQRSRAAEPETHDAGSLCGPGSSAAAPSTSGASRGGSLGAAHMSDTPHGSRGHSLSHLGMTESRRSVSELLLLSTWDTTQMMGTMGQHVGSPPATPERASMTQSTERLQLQCLLTTASTTGRSTARHDIVDTCELSTGGGVQFIQSPSQAGAPAAGLLSALSSASRSLHHMSSVERRVATANNSSASASSHMSHYEKIARQSGRRSTRGAPSLSGRKSLKDTPATIYSQGDRQSSGGGWGSGGGGGGGHHATTTQRGTRFGAGAVDSIEIDIEDAIIANRRRADARKLVLDEIRVERVLGFGSMGMVYFGVLWDNRVVVKMIEHSTGVLGKQQNRGRLARAEAVISRLLVHPNIVLTYDMCTGHMDAAKLKVSGSPGKSITPLAKGRQRQMTLMVQEFCDLGTLRDALNKRRHGLDPEAPAFPLLAAQLALDIANGMRYMHSLRVLHIDLKAENVLLQRSPTQGGGGGGGGGGPSCRSGELVAKVADFGLAQVLGPDQDMLHTGIHGTVSHMPPEAMRAPQSFGFATDVFSFGVTVWEIVTLGKPYAGKAPHEVVESVCSQGMRPSWPDNLHPILDQLATLATQCWDADPAMRPSFCDITERLRSLCSPDRDRRLTKTRLSVSAKSEACMSDESDELEAALRAQRKAATATAVPPAHSRLSYTGEVAPMSPLRATDTSAAGGLPTEDSQALALERARFSRASLEAVLARGPPKDILGRMLFALAQPPPPFSQLKQQPCPAIPGATRFYTVVQV